MRACAGGATSGRSLGADIKRTARPDRLQDPVPERVVRLPDRRQRRTLNTKIPTTDVATSPTSGASHAPAVSLADAGRVVETTWRKSLRVTTLIEAIHDRRGARGRRWRGERQRKRRCPSIVIAVALIFEILSFRWLNARRGRLKSYAPHSFASSISDQLTLLHLLIFHHRGCADRGLGPAGPVSG